MGEIEAIKSLRKLASDFMSDVYKRDEADYVRKLADEIEAEIESQYMKLPVDADGVPIHVGDMVNGWGTLQMHGCGNQPVHGMYLTACFAGNNFEWRIDNDYGFEVEPKDLHHVKPRALEDVLRDVWNEAVDYAKSDRWRDPEVVFVERADEIRELLGGDAE